MRLDLGPAHQRMIAIAILGVLVLLMLTLVAWPMWVSWSQHAERVAMLKRQAVTMEGFVEATPRFEAAAKKLAANPEVQLLTYAAPQPTLAVAQLQGQLSQLINGVGAVVASSQPLPDTREGALTKITVQTMVEAEVKAFVKLLHGIAAARPLLRIEKLVVRDPDGEWTVTPQATAPNKLQVEIVVSAYMRAP